MSDLFERLRCARCGTTPLVVARIRVGRAPALAFDCHGCGHETVVTLREYIAQEPESVRA